jgi:outer membrane lipoprotein-sorting protein
MRARIAVAAGCVLLCVPALAAGRGRASFSWADAVDAYARVHDYTCTYHKQERAIDNGDLQVIRLYFRKPLDVKLEWLTASGKVDQLAVYRQGMNDGKLLAHRTGGIASLLGTVKLDPKSGRALEDSRHPITEVGLGHIIEAVAAEVGSGSASIAPASEDMLDGRPAYRFEIEAKSGILVGVAGARRATIWVDRELTLPVKVEIRDAAGGLVERHRFVDIRINVGLTDQVFTL